MSTHTHPEKKVILNRGLPTRNKSPGKQGTVIMTKIQSGVLYLVKISFKEKGFLWVSFIGRSQCWQTGAIGNGKGRPLAKERQQREIRMCMM